MSLSNWEMLVPWKTEMQSEKCQYFRASWGVLLGTASAELTEQHTDFFRRAYHANWGFRTASSNSWRVSHYVTISSAQSTLFNAIKSLIYDVGRHLTSSRLQFFFEFGQRTKEIGCESKTPWVEPTNQRGPFKEVYHIHRWEYSIQRKSTVFASSNWTVGGSTSGALLCHWLMNDVLLPLLQWS